MGQVYGFNGYILCQKNNVIDCLHNRVGKGYSIYKFVFCIPGVTLTFLLVPYRLNK